MPAQNGGMELKMKNYKILVQYEGTRYHGWQRQGNAADTIQGKLEAVLSRLDGAPVEVIGSGRTDAGARCGHAVFKSVSAGGYRRDPNPRGTAAVPQPSQFDTQDLSIPLKSRQRPHGF